MRYNREKGCYVIPVSVNISVTEKCLLRCPFCFQDNNGVAEMDSNIICSYLDELSNIGTKHVQFSGGEPILYKPLVDVIAYAKKKGFTTRIATSGVGINEQFALQLQRAGLDYCHLSLNGSTALIHEITRSCFEETLEAMKLLSAIHMPLVINWVANHKNLLDLPALIDLAKTYGVMYISVLKNKKNVLNKVIEPLTAEDIFVLKRIYKENRNYLSIESCFFELQDNEKNNTIASGCRAGRFYMAISARNEFSPCPHSMKVAAQGSIMEYWNNNIEINEMRNKIENSKNTKGSSSNYVLPCVCKETNYEKPSVAYHSHFAK